MSEVPLCVPYQRGTPMGRAKNGITAITLTIRTHPGSLIRNGAPLGPYSRTMPRALRWSWGGGLFLMSE